MTQKKNEVVTRVLAALEREPAVNLVEHPIDVEWDPAWAALTLEGEVHDIAAKKLALERAAEASGGVVHIVDRLRVAPAERMGDGALRDHLRALLLEEPAFERTGLRVRDAGTARVERRLDAGANGEIELSVQDGVVTLDGWVSSLARKRLLGALAWWAPGTRDVVNGVEVRPPEEDSDEQIREGVKLVLERDRWVDAAQISVAVKDRVVTLWGLVRSERERHLAVRDAWYVFGVDRVEDRLRALEPAAIEERHPPA